MKLLTPLTNEYPLFDRYQLANYLAPETQRYQHILGVVRCMETLLAQLDIDHERKSLLLQACYLHDIGYSDQLNHYRYHPLDGAIFAKDQGFPKPVIAAVLFHSCAYESALKTSQELKLIYQENDPLLDHEDRLFIDLVTFCDLHTSSTGEKTTLDKRVQDVVRRYGESHPVSQMMLENKPTYEEIVRRAIMFLHNNRKK